MTDIIGKALLDYHFGNYTEDLINETNISEADELPLPYFFRTVNEMPPMEQKAMELTRGKVLDVGCGAGCHSLYLQQNGLNVTAIDTSIGAAEVCRLRGLSDVRHIDLLHLKDESYDTILLLMNGTGIFQKLEFVTVYLRHLKSLLASGGQILIDSSDLQYIFDKNEDGSIWIPGDSYYGELQYILKYKGEVSELIDWLYLDERIFERVCSAEGLSFKVIARGDNYDYLAQITI